MIRNLPDPQKTTRRSRFLVSASARINYAWALYRPNRPPFIVLTEFPRSGGNWIRDLLAEVLNLPAPRFSRLPVTFRAIVHSHDHRPTDHPSIYVLRDPRDVFLSHFHKTVTGYNAATPSLKRKILSRHPSLAGRNDLCDSRALKPDEAFYNEWMTRSVGARVSWPRHVGAFLRTPRDNIVPIRYEDMMNDGVATLVRAASRLSGEEPDHDIVEFALKRNEFARQTGRAPGDADNAANKRQGLAGAWRRDLPPALALCFSRDMTEELGLCGYEG